MNEQQEIGTFEGADLLKDTAGTYCKSHHETVPPPMTFMAYMSYDTMSSPKLTQKQQILECFEDHLIGIVSFFVFVILFISYFIAILLLIKRDVTLNPIIFITPLFFLPVLLTSCLKR
jgi:hypothetical protein